MLQFYLARRTGLARCQGVLLVVLLLLGGNARGVGSELPQLGEDARINIERETRIGESVYAKLMQKGLIETDPLLDRYVNDLGFRLLAGIENRVRDYRFFIVRDDAVNAFALPGGFIGVNRGLINKALNQHQLASVLAHEVAHVELRHGLDLMQKGRAVSNAAVLAMLAGLLLGGVDSQVGAAVVYGSAAASQQALVNFTRENEYEADRVGVELLHNAGFDTRGMVEFFRIMTTLSGSSELGNIEYLRTHPVNENRIGEAIARVRKRDSGTDQVDDFLLFKDYLEYVSRDHLPDQGSEYLRALAAMQASDYRRADQMLSSLYELDSENIWYGIAYAENLERLGRENDAELVYRRQLDIFPGDYALSLRLLSLLKHTGQNQAALLLARKLENRYPERQQVYFELSEIYQALQKPSLRMMAEAEFHRINGNRKQAIKLYEQILASGEADIATESKAREKRLQLLEN